MHWFDTAAAHAVSYQYPSMRSWEQYW